MYKKRVSHRGREQESPPTKRGILCDEVGRDKTKAPVRSTAVRALN